ncbi:hypothetical protein K525DRAFT_214057 [Schizophyllum commune Loenen D]|nr:hypothetical protein K525DRAFT_214057 [Schizophyllum commune Loenen D]
MCFVAILCTRYMCGHVERRESVKADCNKTICAFSASHDMDHHDCQRSCRQR